MRKKVYKMGKGVLGGGANQQHHSACSRFLWFAVPLSMWLDWRPNLTVVPAPEQVWQSENVVSVNLARNVDLKEHRISPESIGRNHSNQKKVWCVVWINTNICCHCSKVGITRGLRTYHFWIIFLEITTSGLSAALLSLLSLRDIPRAGLSPSFVYKINKKRV